MPRPDFDKPMSTAALISHLVDRAETVIKAAEAANYPLEMDPFRAQLFDIFALAEASGLLIEMEPHLQADALAEKLSERWNLKAIGEAGLKLSATSNDPVMRRVQLLWSACRLWMAWTYAWERWDFYHSDAPADEAATATGSEQAAVQPQAGSAPEQPE